MSSDETPVIADMSSSASEAAPASRALREEVQAAVEALQAALGDRLVGVVLYGSRARGEGTEDSDWDLLVIAEDLPAKAFDRYLYFKQVLPATRFGPVSVLAKTPQQFAEGVSSLHLDIALDGQILYDPRRYVSDRLGALRRLMKTLGLYRQRTPEGFDWRWSGPSPVRWWNPLEPVLEQDGGSRSGGSV